LSFNENNCLSIISTYTFAKNINLKNDCITMKKNVLILGLLFIGSFAICQNDKQTEYLFGNNGSVMINGFGAPFVEFSKHGDEFAVSSGGGGAVLINQTFFFGAYGMGLATEHTLSGLKIKQSNGLVTNYPTMRKIFGHGGFWLGYIHNRKEAIHWGLSTKIGWGSVGLCDADLENCDKGQIGIDNVFVFSPQVEMEMNMTRWFKINIGAGYRFVSGIDKTYVNADGITQKYYDSSDFNSPQLTIGLLFGGFGR
jgi:hypothetical protein